MIVFLILDIKDCAQAVNLNMLELVSAKERERRGSGGLAQLDLKSVVDVLRQYLDNSSIDTKLAVMKWINHLFTEARDEAWLLVQFWMREKLLYLYKFIDDV